MPVSEWGRGIMRAGDCKRERVRAGEIAGDCDTGSEYMKTTLIEKMLRFF